MISRGKTGNNKLKIMASSTNNNSENKSPAGAPGKNLKNYLDMLFNEEGLKTDLKVTVTNETMYKLIAVFIGGGVVVAMAAMLFRSMLKDKQLTEISVRLENIESLMKHN
jgi:mannitol-specific phosphotransferase system IIBC component